MHPVVISEASGFDGVPNHGFASDQKSRRIARSWIFSTSSVPETAALSERSIMSIEAAGLSRTVRAMRPVVPAKDFDVSKRFYIELGFEPRPLTERLVEMQLGVFSFILQDHYAREWADNFVVHLTVSDIGLWWDHIASLDLPARYGAKVQSPESQGWAMVAGVTDPCGVLWRFAEIQA
jgi:hypothetical protein